MGVSDKNTPFCLPHIFQLHLAFIHSHISNIPLRCFAKEVFTPVVINHLLCMGIPILIREDMINVFSSGANISKRYIIRLSFSTDGGKYFSLNNRKSLQASKIFATRDFRKNPSQECRYLTKENLYRRIHKNIVSIKRYSKSRIFKFETVFCDYLGMSFFPLLPSVRPRQLLEIYFSKLGCFLGHQQNVDKLIPVTYK